MEINGRKIGSKEPPYVIAELSGNHNQDISKARELIKIAAEAGCDAVKLQTYTPDTMTLASNAPDFQVHKENDLWGGQNLYDLYLKAHTPWEWHPILFDYASEVGITIFSSPFDISAVDFLESLNVCAYKIASFELTDIPLLRKIASTSKPVIMSTGMATYEEIEIAYNCLKNHGASSIALLKCTSAYPSPIEDLNLNTIPLLKREFSCEVGLSDHTLGLVAPIVAVAKGATIIEKHITKNRNDGGVDSAFSLEPSELLDLVTETNKAHASMGIVSFGTTLSDNKSLKYRRSIYCTNDLEAGSILTENDLKVLRPVIGLSPIFIDKVIGARIKTAKKKNDPIYEFDIVDFDKK